MILPLLTVLAAQAIGVEEYCGRLSSVAQALESGDLARAKETARALSGLRVTAPGLEFIADPTLLAAVEGAADAPAARPVAARIRALVAEIGPAAHASAGSPADPELLERLRREEERADPSRGGRVGGPEIRDPKIPPSVIDRLLKVWEDVVEALGRFIRWLVRLLMGRRSGAAGDGSIPLLVVLLVAGVLALLALLSFLSLRRGRRITDLAEAVSAPAQSARDEDPLSRTANEWERFAAELMRAGRYREAIRAWYHAVLVTSFRAGFLYYRKDRTNWEYAYALGPEVPWRPGFLEATRTFEREWYGRRESPQETAETYQRETRAILGAVLQGGRR
jgi:hypothetical protein